MNEPAVTNLEVIMHLSILGPTTPLRGRDGELWVDFSPFRRQNLPHRWGICFCPFSESISNYNTCIFVAHLNQLDRATKVKLESALV